MFHVTTQILDKLSVVRILSDVCRAGPTSQESAPSFISFQEFAVQLSTVITAVSSQPIARTSGAAASRVAATDVDASQQLRREAIANAATISYDQRELLGVIVQYLNASGLKLYGATALQACVD